MLTFSFNTILVPLFATWFIPVSIRDQETGRFKGFWNVDFMVTFSALIISQCYFMISQFGLTPMTVVKVAICVVAGLSGGIVYVYFTHEKMFGSKFEMKLKSE
ncbi:MAG: hypothetical protein AB8B95_10555 [Pseudohongiellaceae bacterium]